MNKEQVACRKKQQGEHHQSGIPATPTDPRNNTTERVNQGNVIKLVTHKHKAEIHSGHQVFVEAAS